MLRQLPQESLGSSVLSVKVNVLPASPPDPALRPKIEGIEQVRADGEQSMFGKARGDARALTSFITNELEAPTVRKRLRWQACLGTFAHCRRSCRGSCTP